VRLKSKNRTATPRFFAKIPVQHNEISKVGDARRFHFKATHQRCPSCRKKSRTSRTSLRSVAAKTLSVSWRGSLLPVGIALSVQLDLDLCYRVEPMLTVTSHIAARIKKNKKNHTIKFKVRCKRYLYTLVLKDLERAEKLKQSLPPGIFQHHVDDKFLALTYGVSSAANK